MSKIKCIIIDDEPLAQDVISDYISRLDFLVEIGRFDDSLSAIQFINTESVDLIFLDIQMPMLDGINFVKALSVPSKIIFTTAHRHYAVDGFELNAIDYLVKPIPFYRFVQAIEKLKVYSSNNHSTKLIQEDIPEAAFFKVDNKKIKIRYNDILYVESLKDYIKVVTKDQSFVTYQTLSGVLSLLPDSQFIQVHKSFIINYHYVKAIEGNMLEIEEHTIPIGRSFRDEALVKIYDTARKGWR